MVQNEVSANVRPSQKGPDGQGASIVGNAKQVRMFAATEQQKDKYA